MNLTADQIRVACYCVSEIIRSRERTGASIPGWLRRHYNQLNTAVASMSPTRQPVVENGHHTTQLELIGTREAAELLGISTRQVQRHADDLGGQPIGGRLIFNRDAVLEHAERRHRG